MNPLLRSLPHHQKTLWRCLPCSAGGCVSVSTSRQLNIQIYLRERFIPVCSLESGDGHHHGTIPMVSSQSQRPFHTACRTCVEHKVKRGLEDYLSVLGVDQDCSDQELREAFLHKAKAFHPDSLSPTADAYKFSQVKDAYRAVLEHRKGAELNKDEEEEADIIFDIKHTAPQHRQYLEFEGLGFGSPSQRQRQYQQHRVARVTENVFQHRMQRLAAETEAAPVVRDKQQAKKTVISNALERIVEDLIQESMKRGDFDNLPGQGRPLEHSAHNPFVDVSTHNLNKILVNNGFAPEWIMLQSEITKELQRARQILAQTHSQLTEPHTAKDTKTWHRALDTFDNRIRDVNEKIQKFNLIVPFLNKQKMPYNAKREREKVLSDVERYLPEDSENLTVVWDVSLSSVTSSHSVQQAINWRQVWRDIRNVFRSSDSENEKVAKT